MMCRNSTYMTLQDDDLAGGGPTHVLAQGVVLTKFCSFGLVMSKTWDLTYIVVRAPRPPLLHLCRHALNNEHVLSEGH